MDLVIRTNEVRYNVAPNRKRRVTIVKINHTSCLMVKTLSAANYLPSATKCIYLVRRKRKQNPYALLIFLIRKHYH